MNNPMIMCLTLVFLCNFIELMIAAANFDKLKEENPIDVITEFLYWFGAVLMVSSFSILVVLYD